MCIRDRVRLVEDLLKELALACEAKFELAILDDPAALVLALSLIHI